MIRTVFAFIFLFFSVIFLTLIEFLVQLICLFGLWKYRERINYCIAKIWALSLIKISACEMIITGRENIPKEGGLCFVCNHGSIFDIALLLAYTGRLTGFIAKKELMYIPLLNLWIPVLGGLYIDRNNLRKGLKTINKGISRIKAGGAMAVFPEGHRSRGQGLLPFRPGALKLATQAQAPIVPVAISGSYDVFEKTGRVCPGTVRISFCKAIHTADIPAFDRKHLLSEQVYQIINEALGAQGFGLRS